MTEKEVLEFLLKNWGGIAWMATTVATVIGLIVYNAKIILPGLIKRMDKMEKEIKELKDSNFVTEGDCKERQVKFDTSNSDEHKKIQDQIDKVLECVLKGEERRQRAKIHQISFMTAVKEKLDLKFKVPEVS